MRRHSTGIVGDTRHVRFQPTPKMSFLSAASFVGDLERVSRTIEVDSHRDAQGRRAMAEVLRSTDGGNPALVQRLFPAPPIVAQARQIARPGRVVFGRDGELGAISLLRSAAAGGPGPLEPVRTRQAVRGHAHEVAHQWFGNSSTMHWWMPVAEQGFATWMSGKGHQHAAPEWKPCCRWSRVPRICHATRRGSATHPIVHPVNSLEAVSQAFELDCLQQRPRVIRMIEDAVGESPPHGVRSYMRKHA